MVVDHAPQTPFLLLPTTNNLQAFQIALALSDEVADLEAAGCKIIQMDEPALREGLPLKPLKKAGTVHQCSAILGCRRRWGVAALLLAV